MPSRTGQVWQHSRGGITLKVRLTPKSSRDEISGAEDFGKDRVLKARVRAVPDKGKANTALVKLVANWLSVPVSSVNLVSGGKSRLKSVAVAGDANALMRILRDRLADRE